VSGGYSINITSCTITDNTAPYGGGILVVESSPTITNCILSSNFSDFGGGIYCAVGASPLMTNCTITENHGSGGGIGCDNGSTPTITNSILWADTTYDEGPEIWVANASTLTVSYSDVQGGQAGAYVGPDANLIWGSGNLSVDPSFVGSGDYHLQATSLCIDAGDNSASGIPATDIDGDNRIIDGDGDELAIVDMGSDEFKETTGYSAVANAEASVYGSASLTGSGLFNELALFLVPTGAVIFLRILRRKR